jgi:energy-coupling factor transport system permease protein
VQRSRYRPDPWLAAEWLTLASGVAAAAGTVAAALVGTAALNPSVDPPAWPGLPVLPLLGLLAGLLPAFVTPPPPSTLRPARPVRAAPARAEAA